MYNLASIFNAAFSGMTTGIKKAVNPITGLTAVTPFKSSYSIHLNVPTLPGTVRDF